MRWTKRKLLTLCLPVVALYFGQYASTASIKKQDDLNGLIKSGGSLPTLDFRNQVTQPDVRINGTEVPKCKGVSCIVGSSLIPPPNFCSPATTVTLYPGSPPSPQNFTGSELCRRFLYVEPTCKSEENGYSYGSIFGYVCGILGLLDLVLLSACFVFGLCHFFWKRLKKKDEEELKFSEPQNQQDVGNANGGQSILVHDNFGGEERVDGEQPGAVPNIFDRFLDEVEMILREAKEGVLTIQSLRKVCRRAGCQLAACSHHLFDMHVKLGNTEVAINYETCPPKVDLAIASLENKAKEIIFYKETSCQSKCFQGFLFYHNAIADSFDLSYLDVSLYKVEIASGTEPDCFRMFKEMLHMLIREQAARLSDYPVSETDVCKPVDAVTKEDPDETATVIGSRLIRRNPSSRSMARSDGGELYENTPSNYDTPKFFTGEQDEFKEIDDEDTEC